MELPHSQETVNAAGQFIGRTKEQNTPVNHRDLQRTGIAADVERSLTEIV